MRFTEMGLTRQIVALAVLIAVMAAIVFGARAFFSSLPDAVLFPVTAAIFALALGVVIGDRSATKRFQRERHSDCPPPEF